MQIYVVSAGDTIYQIASRFRVSPDQIIYDNQITIKPGVTAPVTQTGEQGLYGSEHMYIRRWYQPYNEKGRTHTYGFTYKEDILLTLVERVKMI